MFHSTAPSMCPWSNDVELTSTSTMRTSGSWRCSCSQSGHTRTSSRTAWRAASEATVTAGSFTFIADLVSADGCCGVLIPDRWSGSSGAVRLRADLVDDVERCIGGTPDPGEARLRGDGVHGGLACLVAQRRLGCALGDGVRDAQEAGEVVV